MVECVRYERKGGKEYDMTITGDNIFVVFMWKEVQ